VEAAASRVADPRIDMSPARFLVLSAHRDQSNGWEEIIAVRVKAAAQFRRRA